MARTTKTKTKTAPPDLATIVAALDTVMESERFQDASNNGLQVSCSNKPISRVCCGVDASLACIEAAAAQGADLLVCHHGISWGSSLKHITGLNYRHIEFLIAHDMALWACHLPLDAHMELGNNAGIAQVLGLRRCRPFAIYNGTPIGVAGTLARPLAREAFEQRLAKAVSPRVEAMRFGPPRIRNVGIVAGGGASSVSQAFEAGLDTFISGEATLQGYNLAQQLGINAYFCGHYATERFGVQALGRWIEQRFGIPATFIDLQVPY